MTGSSFDFELLALIHADWELGDRTVKNRRPNPSMPNHFKALDKDQMCAFYYGLVNDHQVPQTVSQCIADNIGYYEAGSLSDAIIELGGQG